MSVWAIVPVKPFAIAKSRLASVLSAEQRARLGEAMLIDTLETMHVLESLAGICVVTSDPQAAFIAGSYGARVVDDTAGELNGALQTGADWVKDNWNASSLLVLPADLPVARASDIDGLIARLPGADGAVLAPAHDGDGTNAIVLGSRVEFNFAFGPGSFARHRAAAAGSRLKLEMPEIPRIARDLDRPEDIAPILEYGRVGRTAALLLEALGLAELSERLGAQ